LLEDLATETEARIEADKQLQSNIDTVTGNLNKEIADRIENDNSIWKELTNFKNTKGKANGLASLDDSGKVPSTQLPSYVDDVLEFTQLD
jgi:hypothetical protein